MDSFLSAALSILAGGVALWTTWMWTQWRAPHHLPPGPKPWPIIGNLLDFPMRDAAQVYVDWAAKCNSNIVHASAFGSHTLILNKREDAIELLENRSRKYSNRPYNPIIDMVGWQGNVALMQYGNFWRLHKKICQQSLRQEAAPLYNPVQLDKMKLFLRNLLETPEDFERHNKLFSVGIPLGTMYGYDVQGVDDPCVEAADESAFLAVRLLLPGGSILSVFPILRHIPAWFPGAVSRRIAEKARDLTQITMQVPMENLKKRMAEGPVAPSLVSTFLQERNSAANLSEREEEIVANVAYTVYGGTFFHLIATHPEVQKRAQEELDRIVGSSRLPVFEDREQLPYIEAIYREVLRWQPPLSLCIPHILSEDDYYKGYFIPKGTAVFANLWAMTHDEEVYKNPHKFVPERFLDANGALTKDDRVLAYGFGRRICVGKHVASSSMWLLMASILATFNLGKAQDEHGKDIPINDEYTDANGGFMQHKVHFHCSIKPRSDCVKELFMV
ncbi:hypothetical protein HYPSUDRAFT_71398 [Hypholoma sublateritium FD-334 SS-4]|uniref:Cytochrome P450 n=1 Tax=Hypholoma sublateritium (strain FD-334 SS-4) TaxID=945553 RepID=A0A0D2KP48_HYPSF|nr:hypothetical protein HYPSUDRAFT_71398 [Hypholoma sublateritium FD-334 SS-4]